MYVINIVAMVSAVRDDSGRRLTTVRSNLDRTDCAEPLQKVIRCLPFHFLLGYFLLSLR